MRSTQARNASTTPPCQGAAAPVVLHASSWRCSRSDRLGSDGERPGRAARRRVAASPSKSVAKRSIVERSNRSVAYSNDACNPSSCSVTASDSSNFATGTCRSASASDRPGRSSAAGGVLQREHRLEERRAAAVAARLQMLDELLERDVRVGEGVERDFARARQQLAEAHVGVERHPQHQRVHEKPDHVLHRRVAAGGDGRADAEIRLSGEAEQHGLVERQQRDEERHTFDDGRALGDARRPSASSAHEKVSPADVRRLGRGRSVGSSRVGSGPASCRRQ